MSAPAAIQRPRKLTKEQAKRFDKSDWSRYIEETHQYLLSVGRSKEITAVESILIDLRTLGLSNYQYEFISGKVAKARADAMPSGAARLRKVLRDYLSHPFEKGEKLLKAPEVPSSHVHPDWAKRAVLFGVPLALVTSTLYGLGGAVGAYLLLWIGHYLSLLVAGYGFEAFIETQSLELYTICAFGGCVAFCAKCELQLRQFWLNMNYRIPPEAYLEHFTRPAALAAMAVGVFFMTCRDWKIDPYTLSHFPYVGFFLGLSVGELIYQRADIRSTLELRRGKALTLIGLTLAVSIPTLYSLFRAEMAWYPRTGIHLARFVGQLSAVVFAPAALMVVVFAILMYEGWPRWLSAVASVIVGFFTAESLTNARFPATRTFERERGSNFEANATATAEATLSDYLPHLEPEAELPSVDELLASFGRASTGQPQAGEANNPVFADEAPPKEDAIPQSESPAADKPASEEMGSRAASSKSEGQFREAESRSGAIVARTMPVPEEHHRLGSKEETPLEADAMSETQSPAAVPYEAPPLEPSSNENQPQLARVAAANPQLAIRSDIVIDIVRSPDIPFGGKKLPENEERPGYVVIGSSGTGKTTIEYPILRTKCPLIGKGSGRAGFYFDAKGDGRAILRSAGLPADRISYVHPLDAETMYWDIARDAETPSEAGTLAEAFFPIDEHQTQKHFDNATQSIFAEEINTFNRFAPGKWTLRDVVLGFDPLILPQILEQTEDGRAAWRLHSGDERALGSVYATFAARSKELKIAAALFDHAQRNDKSGFSIREWATMRRESVWVLRASQGNGKLVQPLNRIMFDLGASFYLDWAQEKGPQRMLFSLDEVAQLGKTSQLMNLATLVRSKGGTLFVTAQSFGLLKAVYGGEDVPNVILDQCPNKAYLRLEGFEDAQKASNQIGSIEEWIRSGGQSRSTTYSKDGVSTQESESVQESLQTRPAVRPEQLMQLPQTRPDTGLHGYYKTVYHNMSWFHHYKPEDVRAQWQSLSVWRHQHPEVVDFTPWHDDGGAQRLRRWDEGDLKRLNLNIDLSVLSDDAKPQKSEGNVIHGNFSIDERTRKAALDKVRRGRRRPAP